MIHLPGQFVPGSLYFTRAFAQIGATAIANKQCIAGKHGLLLPIVLKQYADAIR